MQKSYSLTSLCNFQLNIEAPSLIFLYGDLGAGKTTLIQNFLSSKYGIDKEKITSPTYVYYNTYQSIHHFDLYRLRDYDEFISIGGEEILDNNEGIIFVEWPELLENFYTPDIVIFIEKKAGGDERIIRIEYRK